ncbi:alpha/beta hydrolase family protein [Actinophytocola glycyrrhizae]|uniref:Alpha/beta hydrolase family protein n=2 Tax=Actinophytocola glycyrrhizae TaxID=2044873 RepID=A0ABV9S7M4_9PSEU
MLEEDVFFLSSALLGGVPGEVIRSRPLTGPAALSSASRNDLVLYRSTAVDGTPIAVSGIVALPSTPAPQDGYPLVSWAHGTLGLGDKCAPSRDSPELAERLPEHHRINQAPHVLLNALLEAGWAVAMTDYEGLGTRGVHPYLLGESEAYGVLDIAVAARNLHPQISTRLAVVGHSQGGQAALFAGHHAPTRTPGLDLCAVAALAPASHIKDDVLAGSRYSGTTPGLAFTPMLLTGAIIGSTAGATADDTAIDARQVLTDRAYELFESSGDRCRVELSTTELWGGIPGTEQFRGDLAGDPNPHQREFLRQLDLTNPALTAPAPVRISHAQKDTRVAIAHTNRLVPELAALGNDITYRIHPTTADAGTLGPHFGLLTTDTPELLQWLHRHVTAA